MKESLSFSALMSVYNRETPSFLRQALNSILKDQTVKPTEVVLVEDGPLTKELYYTIKEFQENYPCLKVYSLETNQGLGNALRFGLSKCQYDWVARMDSDDISVPDRFEKQIKFIQENSMIDVLGTNIAEFGENPVDIITIKEMPTTHQSIKKMLKRRTPVCHVTAFFRKSAVLKAGSYLDLPFVEDYYLWARMFAIGCRFHSLNEPLVLVRVGNGMIARRGNRKQIDSWKVVNEFLYNQKLTSLLDKWLNMLLIRLFIYMPVSWKNILYQKILRKKRGKE